MKEVDPDFTKNRILDALNRIQYHRIEQNYAILARKILIGDKNEIYTILQYILKDSDKIRDAVYLSKWARGIAKNVAFFALKFNSWHFRYLIPINLPPEALGNAAIANLREEHTVLMNEFKEAHKLHQKSLKENAQMRELRGDIEIIEMEKQNGE